MGRVFATCFTSEYSCEAQWKMYLHNNARKSNVAVEIEFDREQLFNKLRQHHKDLYFGEVVYYPQNCFRSFVERCLGTKAGMKALKARNPLSPNVLGTLLRPLLFKRMAYSYEKEWRLFITEDLLPKNNCLYVQGLRDCIDCVIVDFSKLSDIEKKKKRNLLQQYVSNDKIRETNLFQQNENVLRFKFNSIKHNIGTSKI